VRRTVAAAPLRLGCPAGYSGCDGVVTSGTQLGSGAVADAVEAKGAVDTLYISGITPAALDPSAPTIRGDTKTQTLNILKQLGEILKGQGYGYGDVAMLHVYLVAAADAKDNEAVTKAEVVDLGSLKGNIGDQNYDLPANADLAKYRAVTIWCKRFSVNFGTAPLMNDAMQSMNMQ